MGAISLSKVHQKQLITLAENLPERVMSCLPGSYGSHWGPLSDYVQGSVDELHQQRAPTGAVDHHHASPGGLLSAYQHAPLSRCPEAFSACPLTAATAIRGLALRSQQSISLRDRSPPPRPDRPAACRSPADLSQGRWPHPRAEADCQSRRCRQRRSDGGSPGLGRRTQRQTREVSGISEFGRFSFLDRDKTAIIRKALFFGYSQIFCKAFCRGIPKSLAITGVLTVS